MAKKKTARTPGETMQRQFRLSKAALDELDFIREHLRSQLRLDNRSEAVRYAIAETAAAIRRRAQKVAQKS